MRVGGSSLPSSNSIWLGLLLLTYYFTDACRRQRASRLPSRPSPTQQLPFYWPSISRSVRVFFPFSIFFFPFSPFFSGTLIITSSDLACRLSLVLLLLTTVRVVCLNRDARGHCFFLDTRITDKYFFFCTGNRQAALSLLKQRRYTAPP